MKTNNPNIRQRTCSTHNGRAFRHYDGMSEARDVLHCVVKGRSTIAADGYYDSRSIPTVYALPKGISPPRGDLPKVLQWPLSVMRQQKGLYIRPPVKKNRRIPQEGGWNPVFSTLTEVDVGKSPPGLAGSSHLAIEDDQGRSVSVLVGTDIRAEWDSQRKLLLLRDLLERPDFDIGESPPPLSTADVRCRGRSVPVRNGTPRIAQKETDLGPQRYLAEPAVRDVDIGESPPQRDGPRNTSGNRCRGRSVPVPFAPRRIVEKELDTGPHRYLAVPLSLERIRGSSPPLRYRKLFSVGENISGRSVPIGHLTAQFHMHQLVKLRTPARWGVFV
ncbi:MAG: hypothetical protein WCW35_12360 [Bacteroidota bacterium]